MLLILAVNDRAYVLYLRVKYEIVYFPNVGGVLLLGAFDYFKEQSV